MNVKSLLVEMLLCILSVFNGKAQNSTGFPNISYYYNGAWSQFETLYVSEQRTDMGELLLYRIGNHPSDFFFKCGISMPTGMNSKQIKKMMRSNVGLNVDGVVEYYVTDKYPTMKDVLTGISRYIIQWDELGGDYNSGSRRYGSAAIKKNVRASVNLKIVNDGYKKWLYYTVWFDHVAVGLKLYYGENWYNWLL